ncbi:efflux transporter outer membrane subunit [Sinorhizobium sp. BG8]|uniref:efflux transporter outer membrane subunit n=1 Tax=Sinorhizobium sp. BG8 TaxID=2613773 RepID=UPI00193CC184|nr:efflux transporter outer membrane subunit [Sinorhizobium sp. BG8]QRM56545.1 efflux transporter outer membrane subunit [Sinorhizobium sp. BG8]
MKIIKAALPLTLLLLSGCVVGPDYQAPDTALPAKFSESGSKPTPNVTLNPWWEAFRDKKLNSLIQQGMNENLSVLTSLERIVEAQANVVAAGAGALPQINGSGSATASGEDGKPVNGHTQTKQMNAGVGASWLLDLFGQYRRAVESANASLDAAYADVNVTRLAYFSDLATSYIDLRYYQEALAQTRVSLASRRETLKLTEDIRQAGAASSLDVVQAEGLVNQTLAELPALEIGYYQAANHIATLLGLPAATITKSLEKGAGQPVARYTTKTGVPADLIRNRPDIRKSERELAAATAAIGVAEAQLFPSLTLDGSIGAQRLFTNAVTGNLTSWAFGPSLTVPIFQGGALRAQVDISKSQAQQQYLAWKQTVLNAVEEVEDAQVSINRAIQTVAALRKVVSSYEEALSLARESYRGGATTVLDVLDAERNVADGRLSLAAAIRTQASSFVALNVAIGGAADIGSPSLASTSPSQ